MAEVIHDLLGYDGLKIIQHPAMFRFSLDSLLLANFISIRNNTEKIIDLGTGNAPIPLFLSLKTKANIFGIEIQSKVADLATRSVKLNKLESQIKIINGNIKDVTNYVEANTFDIVCVNPPYFKYQASSIINKNKALTIARHEILITLEEIIANGAKLLNNGGEFYMIHRTDRLIEVINLLSKYKLEVKLLQFVYQKTTDKIASTVLIKAIKGAKGGAKVLTPLYIYNNNEYTPEVLKIFKFTG